MVSARAGHLEGALDRARQAAAASRERATPQLLARGLEYRLRGAGAPDEARRTIDELRRIDDPIAPDDTALRSFLLAEALDVVQGGGAGLRELESAQEVLGGGHPLVALGLAERLASHGNAAAAVDAYRVALSGPLLDLRKPGKVALAGAVAALSAKRAKDAAFFLDFADEYADARIAASALRGDLLAISDAAQSPSRSVVACPDRPADFERDANAPTDSAGDSRSILALGRALIDQGNARGAEEMLWEALGAGQSAAGDILAELLAASGDRSRDLVRVRRQQASLEPGDMRRLELLRAAAIADDARVYACGVEHVLRAFDADAGPLAPPALASQPEQPGIAAFLERPALDAAGEALASLWEGSMHLFVRDAASYAVTGVERVVPGATSAIGRLYESAIRVLDARRIPLFSSRHQAGAPAVQVALLSPPSLILTGDVREESVALRYELGRGMSAALPQNVLLIGLTPPEGRAVVGAVRAAFGPEDIGRVVDARAAQLAESFWQLVPARTQRRLQHLMVSSRLPEYAELLERARQNGRRVGMFLGGDFGYAARTLLDERTPGASRELSLPSLRAWCQREPMLADLFRLAVSPEYAEARWHTDAPVLQRGPSSGKFSLF
jgi:hypothetical protein